MKVSALPKDIGEMLRHHRLGVLATYGGGYPYTSLISLAFSPDLRYLIFPTQRETRKYANLLHETRVSVMLDNRAFEKSPEKLCALTVLGSASETGRGTYQDLKDLLLRRQPHLTGFLSLPQTALIQVVLEKIIMVEGLQKIREFDCPPEAS